MLKVVKLTGAKPEDVPELLRGYVFPLLPEQASADLLGGGTVKAITDTAAFLKEQGKIDAVLPDYATYVRRTSSVRRPRRTDGESPIRRLNRGFRNRMFTILTSRLVVFPARDGGVSRRLDRVSLASRAASSSCARASGCGKTTLLNLMAGLWRRPPEREPRRTYGHRPGSRPGRRLPNGRPVSLADVVDNVAFGLRLKGANLAPALGKTCDTLGWSNSRAPRSRASGNCRAACASASASRAR